MTQTQFIFFIINVIINIIWLPCRNNYNYCVLVDLEDLTKSESIKSQTQSHDKVNTLRNINRLKNIHALKEDYLENTLYSIKIAILKQNKIEAHCNDSIISE